jgi:hypothetical protein
LSEIKNDPNSSMLQRKITIWKNRNAKTFCE